MKILVLIMVLMFVNEAFQLDQWWLNLFEAQARDGEKLIWQTKGLSMDFCIIVILFHV